MKKILFVTRHNPYVRSGGGLATKAFINAFSKLYPNKVDLVLADNCSIDDSIKVNNIIKVKPRNTINRVFSLFTGKLHRFTPKVKELIDNEEYELCVFDGSIVAGSLIKYTKIKNIKSITIHHNYEPQYHLDNKSIESFKGYLSYFIKKNEKCAYLHSDLNLFLTQYDLNLFIIKYGKSDGKSKMIGIFEYESSYKPQTKIHQNNIIKNKYRLVISGSLNSYQTEHGIISFYSKYWNLLSKNLDNFNLTITGRNPSSQIYNTIGKNTNVSIIPNPINIEEIILTNNIFFCPTCIGSGLKLRVMDGLRIGLPILVHEVSARGYDYYFDKPWFQIYSDEESFVKAIQNIKNILPNINNETITKEYLKFFSFESGLNRLESYLKII